MHYHDGLADVEKFMINLQCPKCKGSAIMEKIDRRNKIRCLNCGFEDYILNHKFKKDVKENLSSAGIVEQLG
jgi:Zn ribbon nucleic-acid-binding protein